MGKSGILPRVGAPARRLCSTSTSTAPQRGLPLYRRLSALSRRGCTSTVADTLDKWVAEGNVVRKPVLLRCASELRRFNKHRHALELLEWLEAKGVGFSHRDQAIRLDLLGKTGGVSSAQSYFQRLEKNRYTYGALLSCYCQRGMVGDATSIFNRMKEEDFLPSNTLAYNNIISLYFKLGQFDRVREMFDEMKVEHGCPPDGCTYNLLMQSYAALKDIDKAERVMEEIKEAHSGGLLRVSGRHYTTLASIHVAAGNYDKASLILKELEQSTKLKDRDLFDNLITLHATMGNSSQVHRLWDGLRSKFPKITNRNYLILLRSLAKLGDFEGLKKCYHEWKETSGCSYDERIMLILLNAYLERGLIDEAELLYEDTLERNPTSRIKAIETLIDFAVGKGIIGLVTKYLNAASVLMKDKNLRLNSKRIKAFLKRFQPDKAMNAAEELLEELQKVRVDLDDENKTLETVLIRMKIFRAKINDGKELPAVLQIVSLTFLL